MCWGGFYQILPRWAAVHFELGRHAESRGEDCEDGGDSSVDQEAQMVATKVGERILCINSCNIMYAFSYSQIIYLYNFIK